MHMAARLVVAARQEPPAALATRGTADTLSRAFSKVIDAEAPFAGRVRQGTTRSVNVPPRSILKFPARHCYRHLTSVFDIRLLTRSMDSRTWRRCNASLESCSFTTPLPLSALGLGRTDAACLLWRGQYGDLEGFAIPFRCRP